jgi:inner membrane protein
VVANPEPLLFWRRQIFWRNSEVHGSGNYDFIHGLRLQPGSEPNGLGDRRIPALIRTNPEIRAFFFWSRMPVVIQIGGRSYLTDQRFAGRESARRNGPFLYPLD